MQEASEDKGVLTGFIKLLGIGRNADDDSAVAVAVAVTPLLCMNNHDSSLWWET